MHDAQYNLTIIEPAEQIYFIYKQFHGVITKTLYGELIIENAMSAKERTLRAVTGRRHEAAMQQHV